MKEKSLGIIFGFLSILVSLLSQIIFIPVLLTNLGIENYGIYTLVLSISSYLTLFNFGVMTSYFKFYTQRFKFNFDKDTVNWHYLSLMIFFSTIVLIVSFIFVLTDLFTILIPIDRILVTQTKFLFIILSIKIAISFPNLLLINFIFLQEKFLFLKLTNILKSILNPILIFLFVKLSNPLIFIGFALLINESWSLIFNYYYAKKEFNFVITQSRLNKTFLLSIIRFSTFTVLSMITELLLWNTNPLLISYKLDLSKLAIYSIILLFVDNFKLISSTISSVFIPSIYKISIKNTNNLELTKFTVKVGRIQFIILFLFLSGFWFYGKQFITFWLGQEFSIIHSYLSLLLVIVLVPLIQNILIEVQRAKDLYRFRGHIYFYFSILNLFLTLILMDSLGFMAIIVALSLTILISHVLIMNFYNHFFLKIDIVYFWREVLKLLPSFFLPLTFALLSQYLFLNNLPYNNYFDFFLYLSNIFIYTIIYFLSIFFFGLKESEKSYFFSIFKKALRGFK